MRLEELAAAPSIFRGYHRTFAERPEGSQGYILKITNRSGNEIQRTGLERRRRHGGMKHARRPAVHQIRIAFLSGAVMFSGPDGGLFGRFRAENPIVSVAYLGGGFVVLWIGLTVAWMIWGVKQTKPEREMREGLDAYGNEKNSTKTKAIHE